MAFVRTVRGKNGRQYLQLVQEYRNERGEPRQLYISSLGPVGGYKRKKRGGGFPPIPLNPLNMLVGAIALGAHIAKYGTKNPKFRDRLTPLDPRLVFTALGVMTRDTWNAQRSVMTDDEWARHVATLKANKSAAAEQPQEVRTAPERHYAPKDSPTEAEETMHTNWSFNQAAQRDEDYQEWTGLDEAHSPDASAESAPDASGNPEA
jgi:hypothetical protein